jgi:uncharacterized phiE125 gp8 family phage protein
MAKIRERFTINGFAWPLLTGASSSGTSYGHGEWSARRIGVRVTTPPAVEPITLAQAKARLRITIDDEDDDTAAQLFEARAAAEQECGRAFVTQTLTLYLESFPRGRAAIPLPRPPLQSVTWVKYYDGDGVQQTLSGALYHVATGGEPGRIAPVGSAYWPAVQYGRPEAVEIRYVAGYGLAADVPNEAKAAILMILSERRDNPAGGLAIPPGARRCLDLLDYGEVR